MLNGCCTSWKNWDIFSFQDLCTDPCDIGLCIIMLKYEVMVADEWHDNGPQHVVMVSLCIEVKTLVKMTSTQTSFPETVADSLRNASEVQTYSFITWPGGWT